MKVAVVSPDAFDAPGGVQDQVERIVGWLRVEGHDAWAVAPGSGGPEGTRHVGWFRSVRANRSRAPIAIDPRVVRKVGRAGAGADVVHVHEPFMPMVSLGAILADTPPTVATFHADPGPLVRRAYRIGGPGLAMVGGPGGGRPVRPSRDRGFAGPIGSAAQSSQWWRPGWRCSQP